MSIRKYTLKELESRTGFGSRTIRNYIDKGLLPGAYSRGRYASYGQEHLDRLLFLPVQLDAEPVQLHILIRIAKAPPAPDGKIEAKWIQNES